MTNLYSDAIGNPEVSSNVVASCNTLVASDAVTPVKPGPDEIIGQSSLKESIDDKSTTNVDKSDLMKFPAETAAFPKDTNPSQHDVVLDVVTSLAQTTDIPYLIDPYDA